MRKILIRGTCDRDVAQEARKVADSRGISFSGLLERALERYMCELQQRDCSSVSHKKETPAS